MSCGRDSRRSAAAAAAGAVARRPLALALALVSATLPRGALSRGVALPPQPPPLLNTKTCDEVPYPFGVVVRDTDPGASQPPLPGFEVTCGRNREAMLRIGGHEYRIDFVSVPDSYVVIFAGPITQVCYDRNGKPTTTTPAAGNGPMSLEGTPFTFSKSNKLVNVGCNRTLVANFANTNSPGDPWPSTSCTTWCNGTSDTIIGDSCLIGKACCEAPIPDEAKGAQVFSLSFNRLADQNATGEEYGTCSAAFFLDGDERAFMFNDGDP